MAYLVIGLGSYATLSLIFNAYNYLDADGPILKRQYLFRVLLVATVIAALVLGAVLLEDNRVFAFLFSIGVLIGALLGAAVALGICLGKQLIKRSASP
jgi:hypothetical protein